MKTYQIVLLVVLFIVIGYFIGNSQFISKIPNILNTVNDTVNTSAGSVDLWCENGKYYKRTTTAVIGQPTLLEITRAEFDALVSQGVSFSGCKVGDNGNITA